MKKNKCFTIKRALLLSFAIVFAPILLSSCVQLPENVQPINKFRLDRYLGTWYEIARLDHSFERGLSHVSANYSMRSDGGVKVLNRGYSLEKNSWDEAEGKAYFVESSDIGYLKVSFFGPFYGAYIILELDHENYQYSVVSGPDKSYLWILSRNPILNENIKNILINKANKLGFNTKELIFVEQK